LAASNSSPVFVAELALRRAPRGVPDEYPYSLPAIRRLETLRFPTAVTLFVGENGSGKSTLLEGIAGAFGLNLEGGTKHVRFASRASHSPLFKDLKLKTVPPAPTDSSQPAARADRRHGTTGGKALPVHHRDALADPAGVPWSDDLPSSTARLLARSISPKPSTTRSRVPSWRIRSECCAN
jgi:energy-coupling factor transporter ATP-binding protein EcfA2